MACTQPVSHPRTIKITYRWHRLSSLCRRYFPTSNRKLSALFLRTVFLRWSTEKPLKTANGRLHIGPGDDRRNSADTVGTGCDHRRGVVLVDAANSD